MPTTGRWVTIDEIVSGLVGLKTTIACDDDLRLRQAQGACGQSSGVKPVWRLRTALGHTITATAEHPFMTIGGWRQLGELRVGDYVAAARSLPVARLAGSDVYWDRVVALEERGLQTTYDLQIDGDHSFLANDLIVHNSHADQLRAAGVRLRLAQVLRARSLHLRAAQQPADGLLCAGAAGARCARARRRGAARWMSAYQLMGLRRSSGARRASRRCAWDCVW